MKKEDLGWRIMSGRISNKHYVSKDDLEHARITTIRSSSSSTASTSSYSSSNSSSDGSSGASQFLNSTTYRFRLKKAFSYTRLTSSMGNKFEKRNKVSQSSSESVQLSEEELQLLLLNTNMTREQIVEFHRTFLKDCPSGILTKREFVRMFQHIHPMEERKRKAEKFCDYVFKAIDKDSNDKIEFTDFVVVFSITSFGNLKEKIELAFKIYDIDKNGVIDRTEMLKVIEALYDLTGVPEQERRDEQSPRYKVDEMMKKLDLNRNNVLEFDEFFQGCVNDSLVRKILIDPMFNC